MGQHEKYRPLVRAAALGLALAFTATLPAQAGCRLALALALDVSTSVDDREYAQQRDGLADALAAPEMRQVLLDQRLGWIALAVYEWSGVRQQSLVMDWIEIRGAPDLARAIAVIRGTKRSHAQFPTAIGPALGYGATLLARARGCAQRTLDISGDGVANDGFSARAAYRHFPFGGVTVNGLVVQGSDPEVLDFYRREILRGPGAFVEVAGGYADYHRAMRRKLMRETQPRLFGQLMPGQR